MPASTRPNTDVRGHTIFAIYEPLTGAIHYVAVDISTSADEVLVSHEEAIAWMGGDDIAEYQVRQARRVQVPAIVNTDRTSFAVMTSDEAPVLLDGEPYVAAA